MAGSSTQGDKVASESAREPMLTDAQEGVEADEPEPEKVDPPPVSFGALFRYAKPRDRLILFAGIIGCIGQGASMPLLNIFMKPIIQAMFLPDKEQRDAQTLKAFWEFVIVGTISAAFSFVGFYGLAVVADNISLRVRELFLTKLLEKDVGWYDSNSAAEMSTRLTNDTYAFRQGIGEKFAMFLQSLTMAPAAFIVGFYLSWKLTLVLIGTVPVMAIAMGLAMKVMTDANSQQQEFYAKAGGRAETTLSSIRTVAAFNGYEHEVGKYDELLVNAMTKGTKAGFVGGLSMGFMQAAMWLTVAFGFFVGSLFVVHDLNNECYNNGEPPYGDCFTGGTMISALFSVLFGGMGLGQCAPGAADLTKAKAAAARIYQIIDEPPAFDANTGDELQAVRGLVEFTDICFSYPTRQEVLALDHVSIVVPAGTTAAFVGPSGSGKSTSIALLQRFYDPLSGTVCLDGIDIKTLKLSWLRSQMALVQQEPVLFIGSIEENIAYGRSGADNDAVTAAAKAANAHQFISAFPAKYKTEVGERGAQMSGGQKQRIAIARAIIRDPSVLLLDEATSALDTESERIVQAALDELLAAKRRTTLIIAHRLSTIKDVDNIFVLENGKLLESGTHVELLAKTGSLYKQLVELQAISGVEQKVPVKQITRATSRLSSGDVTGSFHKSFDKSASFRSAGVERVAPVSDLVDASAPISQRSNRKSSALGEPAVEGKEGDMCGLEELDAAAAAEDDAEREVPTRRLWDMQKAQLPSLLVALVAVAVVGAIQPVLGLLLSDATNTFSIPPLMEIPPGSGNWVPYPIQHGLVHQIQDETRKNVWYLIGVSALTMVGFVGMMGLFAMLSERLTREIRKQTFVAMLKQEIGWFDVRTTGQLADRLASEAPLVRAFTGESLAASLQMVATVLTGLGIALGASWQLSLCTIAFLPLLSIGQVVMMKWLSATNETKAGPLVTEAVGNIRTVAAFGLEDTMLQRYRDLLVSEDETARKGSVALSVSNAWTQGCMFYMFGFVFFVGNIFIGHGWIEPQKVMKVLMPLMMCAGGMAQAQAMKADEVKAKIAVKRIFNTIDRTSKIDPYAEVGDKPCSARGQVTFEHVAFSYPSRPDVKIFVDFNIDIQPGQTVAFVGPSGSGKSTTVALLQRFYDPDGGAVRFDGQDVRSLNLEWLRFQMAMVQQEPVLFSGSIRDNIAYGRQTNSRRDPSNGPSLAPTLEDVQAAAKAANAHNFIETFPDSYNTEVGERGAQLSGGQKQRIAIARAMIRDPAVLLLDEATSALDTNSERVVQEALDALMAQKRRTTISIAHRLSTIVSMDMICVIYQGKIVEKGTHAELMKIEGGQYRQLAARQQLTD